MQHKCFLDEIRQFGLLSGIERSLLFLRLKAGFYDDCKSSILLETDFVDDAPLTDLREMLDPLMPFKPHTPTSLVTTKPWFALGL